MPLPPDTDVSVWTKEMAEEDNARFGEPDRIPWYQKHMDYLKHQMEVIAPAQFRTRAIQNEILRLATILHTKRGYAPPEPLPGHADAEVPASCPVCTRRFVSSIKRRLAFHPETGQFISWLCNDCQEWAYATNFLAPQFKSST